jgi:hypothetical protein
VALNTIALTLLVSLDLTQVTKFEHQNVMYIRIE